MRWKDTLLAYTPSVSPACDANTPLSRLSDPSAPSLGVRSTSLANQQWVFDFGSQKTVALLSFLYMNVSSLVVETAPDLATYSAISGSPFAITPSRLEDGQRKLYVIPASPLANVRAVRATMNTGSTTDGLGVYTLGFAAFANAVSTLTRDSAPRVEYAPFTPMRIDGGLQREQNVMLGPTSLEISFPGVYQSGAERNNILDLIIAARKNPVMVVLGSDADVSGINVFVASALPTPSYTDGDFSWEINYRLKTLI